MHRSIVRTSHEASGPHIPHRRQALLLGNAGTETEFQKRQTARFRPSGNSVSVPQFNASMVVLATFR